MQLVHRLRPLSAVLSGALLFVALHLLRLQLAVELEMGLMQALDAGLWVGWLYDLGVLALLAAAAAALTVFTPLSHQWVWLPAVAVIWISALANVLHFRFFGLRLDWWIVRLHWSDVFAVGDSAGELGLTWRVMASAALVCAAIALSVWGSHGARRLFGSAGERWRRLAVTCVPLIVLAVVCLRGPHWAGGMRHTGMVLSDQILRVWFYEATNRSLLPGATTHWIGALPEDGPGLLENPSEVLARFRDWRESPAVEPAQGRQRIEDVVYADERWPLLGELRPNGEQTRAARKRLGLPLDGPIHVVVLFVESLRAYELLHPQLGPVIFPELWSRLREQGILYSNAYSSSLSAGQTVRGEFSTLCGMLPNVLGAATYIAHTTSRMHCLAGMLGGVGYQTLWMNAYKASFHSKRPFEMLHGTQTFFEGKDFERRGITERVGGWGLADEPVLKEAVRILEEQAAMGKPVFANVSTVSTHHPHVLTDKGPLPDELVRATAEHLEYQAYLSQLRYSDRAMGGFFDALFASPISERTLVVLLGDHSIPTKPHTELSYRQIIDMRFRIPIAIITRSMTSPEIIDRVVHQSDVTPTVARLVGERVPISWTSRGLFSDTGTPWVYRRRGPLHYRTPTRACYTKRSGSRTCFDTTGGDPLFAADLPEVVEDAQQSEFFELVAHANLQAIALDRILPR